MQFALCMSILCSATQLVSLPLEFCTLNITTSLFPFTFFVQVTSGFELYLCFSPLGTKAMAVSAVNKLLKWIRKEEDRLFILSPLTY